MRSLFATMLLIRTVEERLAELLVEREIRCPTHLYTGQEAVATGVCATLRRDDYVFGGHRSHGHYLAKRGDLKAMLAELYGKRTGCSRGRGGSMHLVAPEVGFLGTVPIVAATIPIAVGTALASRLRRNDRVSVAFFGDGAVEEGTFHESMNLAASRRLPVLFVCENNFYSSHLHLLERRAKDNIVQSGEAHGMPGIQVDGNDVLAVYRVATAAVQRARAGEGPSLLECRTYRWRGHVGPALDLDVGVRRRDDLAEWRRKDPLQRLEARLLEANVPREELERLAKDIERDVEEAVTFARESPYPDPAELHDYVFKTRAGEGR
ncbi:MAG: dehydrogenase [Candidatus Rokuibacteriota bacterium]|nr:MAG: dehydrogenase [Candidatus Rokubacteria bacterium]